ncbi:hypothetical protein GCM10027572_04310 [Flexivirga lutea]
MPLEALATSTPLVASDRDFVREVCGTSAVYANPHDAVAWARAIIRVTEDAGLRNRLIESGLEIISNWPTSRDRAFAYAALINDAISRSTA